MATRTDWCEQWADHYGAPVFALDVEMRLVGANRVFWDALGVGPEEAMDAPFEPWVGREMVDVLREVGVRLRKNPGARTSGLMRSVDFGVRGKFLAGRRYWASTLRGGPDAPTLFILKPEADPEERFLTDLTRRDELGISLADYINEVVYITDVDGRVIYVNNQLGPKIGYLPEEILGDVIIGAIHHEDVDEFVSILAEARKGLSGVKPAIRVFHKDGRLMRFSLSYGPLRDAAGVFRGVICFARDVTREHSLEQRLQHQRNLEMMRLLAEAITGEFDAVLIGILSNASLLRGQTERGSPIREYVDRIDQAARRAEGLTQQLLACTRSLRGRPTPLDFNEHVGRAVERLRPAAGDDVLVMFHPTPNGGRVYADAVFIARMVDNILQNAFEAIPSTGCITVKTERHRSSGREIGGLPAGEYMRVCVADDGIGIDLKDLERVTEPFFTTKSMKRGLGLTAVQGIVASLDGVLNIFSSGGDGTTVTIDLPIMKTLSLPVPDASAAISKARQVLVIDDEEVVREFCAATFRAFGAEVTLAANGEEGLHAFLDRPDAYDVVLVDLVLPGRSGEETARHILEIRPGANIVFTTGHRLAQKEIERRGLLENRVLITKPFDFQQLVDLLPSAKERDPDAPRGR